jgi:hypothetical protein
MDVRWFQVMEKRGYLPRFSDGRDAAPSRTEARAPVGSAVRPANCSGMDAASPNKAEKS